MFLTHTSSPVACFRHPDSWAAYGRFISAAVHKRQTGDVRVLEDGRLHYFRSRILNRDASLLFAYQDCRNRSESIWATALHALQLLVSREHVDHLNVYVAGDICPQDPSGRTLRTVLNGEFVGLAFPYPTEDILEFPDGFEGFLRSLGHSNRRHMKARQKKALESGLRFEINEDYGSVSRTERYSLGLRSSPVPYTRRVLDAWDTYAVAQAGFFQCSFRTSGKQMLSYCMGFIEQDTAVMMYQLNDVSQEQLGLSMALRACLIQHCATLGIKRLVLPMGIAGHLRHAASTNPVSQVHFVRRSLPSVAKALLLRIFVPTSCAAQMVATPGFRARIFGGEGTLGSGSREIPHG